MFQLNSLKANWILYKPLNNWNLHWTLYVLNDGKFYLPKVEDVFGSWKLRVYWTAWGLNASIACYRAAHMRASLITTIISTLIQF